VLDRLVEAVRSGESRVLVVYGEPGAGKTALLEYLAGRASGCRVTRVVGVQSEMELAFAGLHQMCAPLLDHLAILPAPQREALGTALGMSSGPVPDLFLVGLAVLGLVSEAAEARPLVCLVDDQQWLDRASAQVLAFVARRLLAEAVGLVFGTRVLGDDLADLPGLMVGALLGRDARTLLESELSGPIDARVRELIIAEARGNPLALLELPRGLTSEELAGGFGFPTALPLSGSVEESFRRRVAALPEEAQRLLLLAAADPTGDPALVQRAAARLGLAAAAAVLAAESGLAEFGLRVQFRHPLVRSAVYWSASAQNRKEAHQALAEVTDPLLDPDRRAWHLAQATSGLDDDVAAELERSAARAQARGGLAAAGAFLQRAATLTVDPARRAARALAAAQAKVQAGAPGAARDLLAMAEAGPLNDLELAHAQLLRARLAYATSRGSDAPLLLLQAARRLEPVDIDLSRATYLDAVAAAMFAGRLASSGASIAEVARAAGSAPRPPHPPRPLDLLLDGLAANYTQGYAAAVPMLREALAVAAATSTDPAAPSVQEPHWLWMACIAAYHIWDDEHWELLSRRYIQLVRQVGALAELPLALDRRIRPLVLAGELAAAAALLEENRTAVAATGSALAPYSALSLAAVRGDEASTAALISAGTRDATTRGEGLGITAAGWAGAVLGNALGRHRAALDAARQATAYHGDLGFSNWALVELIESAARTGMTKTAAHAYQRLTELTGPAGTDWALGLAARSRALLSEGEQAEASYQEAIIRLRRTRLRVDLARAHLLYGEWLRGEHRRAGAREQLRTACTMLESMGAEGFADRARRGLQATGETVHRRATTGGEAELTAQEAQIARLARDGLSNPEIGARLFISARTVQYHLRKVFTKLGISSRTELDHVLSADAGQRPG
jgi:DNA-binding CsgD family transcriptional regulator